MNSKDVKIIIAVIIAVIVAVFFIPSMNEIKMKTWEIWGMTKAVRWLALCTS